MTLRPRLHAHSSAPPAMRTHGHIAGTHGDIDAPGLGVECASPPSRRIPQSRPEDFP